MRKVKIDATTTAVPTVPKERKAKKEVATAVTDYSAHLISLNNFILAATSASAVIPLIGRSAVLRKAKKRVAEIERLLTKTPVPAPTPVN
jgi:hypothetical protein